MFSLKVALWLAGKEDALESDGNRYRRWSNACWSSKILHITASFKRGKKMSSNVEWEVHFENVDTFESSDLYRANRALGIQRPVQFLPIYIPLLTINLISKVSWTAEITETIGKSVRYAGKPFKLPFDYLNKSSGVESGAYYPYSTFFKS